MTVSPESRSLWYRLFHRKLYNQSLISRFDNGLTSSQFHTSLSLNMMYAQFSGLFSSFLLLTTLISGLSTAVCFPLSDVPIGELPLTAFLLLINSWLLVLHRSLPPSKGQTRPSLACLIVYTLLLFVHTALKRVTPIIFYK
ncbi:hypothetical protein RO3G_09875 [Rhizopus delemar RA 99-880]|uniref:Uncharacterized protein n=1 Tax=Rhizopus delemar (strain RA 99-880 / ATCC MYA-4621 / FGSC 9543 / NRRL 43880) TaxID=246409 RepID=I1C9N5_RHIO9|nr:hypothetical protein RO3G_09875 [Rhizopus delemar RA 99-880]|eukprot:EIE85165.1 hypothetical protein RO3G_09875 [Rhizopus delemar RA 99-880]